VLSLTLIAFSTSIDTSTKIGERICKSSDWQNDEPISSPDDCDVRKLRRGLVSGCVALQ
jgi:hypothetical protein